MGGYWAAIAAAAEGHANQSVQLISGRKNRKWQEKMSSTAHQREVKDLVAAGLNPVLSAGGTGASTPQGFAYTGQNPLGDFPHNIQEANRVRNETKIAKEQAKVLKTTQNLNNASAAEKEAMTELNNQLKSESIARENEAGARTEYQNKLKEQLELQMPQLEAYKKMYEGPLGKYIPYVEKFSPFVGSISELMQWYKILSPGKNKNKLLFGNLGKWDGRLKMDTQPEFRPFD